MSKFLLGVLLLPALALAEPVTVDKKVICDNVKDVLMSLTVDAKENPLWIGSGEGSKIALLINKQTQTWTIVQYNTKVACVLATGEEFETDDEPTKRNRK